MTGSRSIAAVLVGLVMVALAAPAASATATQEIIRSEGVLWAEASVDGAGPLTITIKAPKVNGEGREVWQRCRFTALGAGTYRCGIDVAEGSQAAAREGIWVSRVSVDGLFAGRARFSI